MSIAFFTGFPGFLGSELLPRVLARSPDQRAVCLIQAKFMNQAQSSLERLETTYPHLQGRIDLTVGDIAEPDLGLNRLAGFADAISDVFHLAALYDLSAPRETSMRANVDGTRHVLDFAEGLSALRRLHYVSTCYVSGRYAGVFSEQDLELGQSFNNYYEETKHLAEVEVRKRMSGGLPATIYRPAIVVGDSRTGATQKYDGPYFVIRWLLRQPYIALLPTFGRPARTRVNIVPRDYVVDAMAYLSGLDRSVGKTYHLADPASLTAGELVRLLGRATERCVVRVPLPMGLAKFAIDRVPGVYRQMQIPAAALDYFVHPTRYDCARTLADLAGSGVQIPPLPTYVDRLVDFVRLHPNLGSRPMA